MYNMMNMLMRMNPRAFEETQRLVKSNGGIVDKGLINKALNGNSLNDEQVRNIRILCKQLNIPVGNIDNIMSMIK